jgi:hypothetical protein
VIDGLDLVTENLLEVADRLPVVRARDRSPEIDEQRIDIRTDLNTDVAAERRIVFCQVVIMTGSFFLFERLTASSAFADFV